MLCPCGSAQQFAHCCQPIILGNTTAETAERLMRSRFSAYATLATNYIARTYARSKQAQNTEAEIKDWAEQTKWLRLEILDTDYSATENHFVEFKAFYIHNNALWALHERSRFVQESNQWRYIDGNIIDHCQQQTLSRNSDCPCQSGKKYKRCCL